MRDKSGWCERGTGVRPGEMAEQHAEHRIDTRKVLRTTVVIVGAGPAGLAVREEFENMV